MCRVVMPLVRLWSVCVSAWLMTGSSAAYGQFLLTYDWNNPNSGNYSSPLNWSQIAFPLGIPDNTNELARFILPGTYSVQLDRDYQVGSLSVGNSADVTFAFDPPGFFTPRKVYTSSRLGVEVASAGTTTLTLDRGDIRILEDSYVGGETSAGQAVLNLHRAFLTTSTCQVGRGIDAVGHMAIDDLSRWTASGEVVLGDAGDAHLDIDAFYLRSCFAGVCNTNPSQGDVQHAGTVMAKRESSRATARVLGLWTTGDLVVGERGEAEITVLGTQLTSANGISVSSVGDLTSDAVSLGAQIGSSGRVQILGSAVRNFTVLRSSWNIGEGLSLGGTSNAPGGTGELLIGPSNLVSIAAGLQMWSGGQLSLNEGARLEIAGHANLDGVLMFELASTVPVLGQEFTLLTAAGGVNGQFDAALLPALSSGLTWSVNYGATEVVLKVVEGNALNCDVNGDQIADAADAGILFSNWGNAGAGDCNQDGIVDAADAGILFFEWSADRPTLTAVPEPTSAILLATLSWALGWCRRRQSR